MTQQDRSDHDQLQILIVDDNPTNLKVLGGMLDKYGFRVRVAIDGKQAIKGAEIEVPDLILLDIMMPEMDGYEVCRIMKANEKLNDIPIIFVSARVETIDKVKAFNSGGVDYITKPFQIEEVLARVKTHLNLRETRKELEFKNRLLEETLDDLKSMQSQLVQSEKMASLGVLTAGIAHEINNPVNSINSSNISLQRILLKIQQLLKAYDSMSENCLDPQIETINRMKEDLDYETLNQGLLQLPQIIKNGVEKTTEIVQGLKVFSHVDKAEKADANINENIDSTLSLLRNRTKNKITIIRDYGDLPLIKCYPGKLNQVFMNVLTNAIDAIAKDESGREQPIDEGSVTIRTRLEENESQKQVLIEIKDTGRGISKENQQRMFDPFFTTKDVGYGTGLGLSISIGIVKDHNGTITVTSAEGQGTTMYIQFPVED